MAKQRVTIHLEENTVKSLKRQAEAEGQNFSFICQQTLDQHIMLRAKQVGVDIFFPEIERIIKREIRSMSNRHATLLSATVLHTLTTRYVMTALVIERLKVPYDEMDRLVRSAWNKALDTAKKSASEVREVSDIIGGVQRER